MLNSIRSFVQSHAFHVTLTLTETTTSTVNCKQTFDGVWQFAFEINQGGGGICNTPDSVITACQAPGSPYVDNQVFTMKFGKCPEVPDFTGA